jgi:hypothetical protein
MAERSKYVKKVIERYYENIDAISIQRLQEIVSNLYLSEGKGRARQWKLAEAALAKLKVPAPRVATIVQKDDPTLLAKLIEELLAAS